MQRTLFILILITAPLGSNSYCYPGPPASALNSAATTANCASRDNAIFVNLKGISEATPLRSSYVIASRKKASTRRASIMLMAKLPESYEQKITDNEGIFKRMRKRISSTIGAIRGEKREEPGKPQMRKRAASTSGGIQGEKRDGLGDPKTTETMDDKQEYKTNVADLRLRMSVGMADVWNRTFKRPKEWVVACPKYQVGPGVIIPCVVNGLDIIVFASRDGSRLDAFANSCPHLGSPFDQATIAREPVSQLRRKDDGTGDGCVDCIVCPVHRTAFEIQSGDVSGEWCPYPPILGGVMGYAKKKTGLIKFAVRLRGKNVEVRIATPLKNVEDRKEDANGVQDMR